MPRSIQDILDHADEIARQFENLEPADATEVSVAIYLLRRSVVDRARSERHIVQAVLEARQTGLTWKQISSELGISAQAAQQRYGSQVVID
jgi:hypothetical protein